MASKCYKLSPNKQAISMSQQTVAHIVHSELKLK